MSKRVVPPSSHRSPSTLETPAPAPRGRWVSLRVAPLGHEWHPLSVTSSASGSGAELSAVVSARAGDWTRALADLCAPPAAAHRCEVEVAGPYPFGGGAWSLSAEGGEQEISREPIVRDRIASSKFNSSRLCLAFFLLRQFMFVIQTIHSFMNSPKSLMEL